MKIRRVSLSYVCAAAGALLLTGMQPVSLRAQSVPGMADMHHGGDQKVSNALVETVRAATERYKDVAVAEADGYQLLFGCVSGPDGGAMGLHYVNLGLVGDGLLDPQKPEIVIYEPRPNGKPKLIGADFLVFSSAWNAANPAPPQLMGQLMNLFEAPNRFGLPEFYTLHVWAWKDSPTGTFVNWHSKVSCDAYSAPQP